MVFRTAAELERITSADRLWEEITKRLKTFGIDHVIYLTADDKQSEPYVRCTVEGLYGSTCPRDDPFLKHCCNSYDIARTGVEFLDEHSYLPTAAQNFIRNAAAAGFRSGLGIPMRLRGTPRCGGFNLGTGLSREEFLKRIWPRAEDFRLFCLLMHRRIEELTQPATAPANEEFRTPLIAPDMPTVDDVLSPREREVIYLLARGSTRKEAAHACDISVHTVSDYAKTAYRKLGVRNRAQAAQLIFATQPANGSDSEL